MITKRELKMIDLIRDEQIYKKYTCNEEIL